MSWQAEYEKKYRERLEREWTVEGERKSPNLIGSDCQFTVLTAKSRLDDLYPNGMQFQHKGAQWQIHENTREICGND